MYDYVAFHQSTQNDGYDNVAVAVGEDLYGFSGDQLFMPTKDMKVIAAGAVTAAIANWSGFRFKRTQDPDYNQSEMFVRDQTGIFQGQTHQTLAYPAKSGDVFIAEVNNTNNAQVENVFLCLTDQGKNLVLTTVPFTSLPPSARWIQGTGATAAIANKWVTSATTWSYNFNRDKKYKIIGMRGWSGTGYGFRLFGKQGSNFTGNRPGWKCGDSAIASEAVYIQGGDLTFSGLNPPDLQILASGTDANQYVDLLIVEL